MKRWILVSCLLGICSAMPYARHYSYSDPFHVWIHNFLPPHSSPPYWGKRRIHDHDTQQYEYTMPVHPPPLPSQQTPILHHGVQEQFPILVTNQIPFSTRQGQLQQYDIQPPFQQKLFAQQEGHHPVVQQLLPLDRQTQQLPFQEYSATLGQAIYPSLLGTPQEPVQQPQQRSIYPSLYYMPYVANQGAAPGRLGGIVSSEEMQGGGLGAPAYRAMSPDFFGMSAGFGNPPPNRLGQPGDYTVEDDQLGITEQPDVQGGANPAANPSGNGNSVVSLNNNLGGALSNANSNLMNPAGQSQGPAGGLQATVNPLVTQGLPDSFVPFEADTLMPLDPTMSPDAIYTPQTGYEAGQPQDGWHFQEP
ncbi:ameloblastin [Eublepharis macularius]|uniref:Ameloblastin n=1 Tax=Eublepharis macularius TaxID=481883 RepID=A0AA97JS44_EUBMA|nr:ameloblastin [Eublepharis macularius]